MWPVFELTYKLFKSEAVDFLEGTLVDLRFRPKVLDLVYDLLG